MRREGLHCVEREEESVQEEPCNVVKPLVQHEAPERRLTVLSVVVLLRVRISPARV